MDNNDISFGAVESANDPRTLTSDSFALGLVSLPEHGKIALDFDRVNELSNQRHIGICTMCGVRMAAEAHFRDGKRLSEYWGYLIGKVFYDDPLFGHFEGSSALTMLKAATNQGIPEEEFCKAYKLKVDGTYADFIESFKTKYGGKIPKDILDNAAKHRIPGYSRIMPDAFSGKMPSDDGIAEQILAGRVVVSRFAVGDNFHRDKDGKPTRKAKDLLPLRAPKVIESGHIVTLNEYWLSVDDKVGYRLYEFGGPNSWSRTWCVGNTKQEDGYFWFEAGTQRPFFTEAWAILKGDDKYIFTKDLTLGATGPDVVALQKYLVKVELMTMPAGASYGYFGEVTRNGVIRYQAAHGITPVAGYFGPKTREHVNNNQ